MDENNQFNLRQHIMDTIENGTRNRHLQAPYNDEHIMQMLTRRADINRRVEELIEDHIRQFCNPVRDSPLRLHKFTAEGNVDTCVICQEDIVKNDKFYKTYCTDTANHNFHVHCADPWFRTNDTCPTCRADLRKHIPNANQRSNHLTVQIPVRVDVNNLT